MSRHDQTVNQYVNMSRLVLNHKMMKYSKIWAYSRKKISDDDNNDKVIPWIASSKSSDQKLCVAYIN